jgi:hypothetical protein
MTALRARTPRFKFSLDLETLGPSELEEQYALYFEGLKTVAVPFYEQVTNVLAA